jgi:hypothetical protein
MPGCAKAVGVGDLGCIGTGETGGKEAGPRREDGDEGLGDEALGDETDRKTELTIGGVLQPNDTDELETTIETGSDGGGA